MENIWDPDVDKSSAILRRWNCKYFARETIFLCGDFLLCSAIHFDILGKYTARKIYIKIVNVFWSNLEKFEYSSCERETRYDRNIRVIELIRDRAASRISLSLSHRRKWEGTAKSRGVGAIYFTEYPPLCIPIAPISFVVFSCTRFFSHRSHRAYRKGICSPIDSGVSAILVQYSSRSHGFR